MVNTIADCTYVFVGLNGHRPFDEERNGFLLGERRDRVLTLASKAQAFAAGHEQLKVWAGHEQTGEIWRRLGYVLEVVEQKQQTFIADVLGKAVLGLERLRGLLQH